MNGRDPIILGDECEDVVTGMKGIAVAVTHWLYGCTRYGIQAKVVKDGKPVEAWWVDAPQLKVLKRAAVKPPTVPAIASERRHGDRPGPSRAADPQR